MYDYVVCVRKEYDWFACLLYINVYIHKHIGGSTHVMHTSTNMREVLAATLLHRPHRSVRKNAPQPVDYFWGSLTPWLPGHHSKGVLLRSKGYQEGLISSQDARDLTSRGAAPSLCRSSCGGRRLDEQLTVGHHWHWNLSRELANLPVDIENQDKIQRSEGARQQDPPQTIDLCRSFYPGPSVGSAISSAIPSKLRKNGCFRVKQGTLGHPPINRSLPVLHPWSPLRFGWGNRDTIFYRTSGTQVPVTSRWNQQS